MLNSKKRFDGGLVRIRKLDTLYIHLTDHLHFPKEEVSDLLRSQIVYIISSFDKFMHDLIRVGMVETFLKRRAATNAFKNYDINILSFDLITSSTFPPPETVFENTIINSHKHLSFQDPEKVSSGLSLIWPEEHKWSKIAGILGKKENDLKIELKNIVIRRNQIVHEADHDLSTGLIQSIDHIDVINSVNFIEQLAHTIHSLI